MLTNEEKRIIEQEILKHKSPYDDRKEFVWDDDKVSFTGSLYIYSNATLEAPALTTVGGSLYIDSNATLEAPALTTVGGSLYIYSNATLDAPNLVNKDFVKDMANLEERHGFIKADGIGIQFIKKQQRKEYIIYTTPFNNYVVTNGEHSSHAKTVKKAIIDIRFKQLDRNVDNYRDLTPESLLSYEDAVIMYRVITGACSGGTEMFLSSHPELSTRKKYSVKDIMALTQGQYGNETLERFFK